MQAEAFYMRPEAAGAEETAQVWVMALQAGPHQPGVRVQAWQLHSRAFGLNAENCHSELHSSPVGFWIS